MDPPFILLHGFCWFLSSSAGFLFLHYHSLPILSGIRCLFIQLELYSNRKKQKNEHARTFFWISKQIVHKNWHFIWKPNNLHILALFFSSYIQLRRCFMLMVLFFFLFLGVPFSQESVLIIVREYWTITINAVYSIYTRIYIYYEYILLCVCSVFSISPFLSMARRQRQQKKIRLNNWTSKQKCCI